MTLLDRFRTQARDKHSDPVVRLAFVAELPLDDRTTIAAVACEDEDPRVRKAAVAKLMVPSVLASIARDDKDEHVRAQAATMLRDIALEAFEDLGEVESRQAVDGIVDSRALAQIAKSATREAIALRALERVQDTHMLGSVARHAAVEAARRAALDALQARGADRGEILSVAMNSDFKDTAIAAVDLLADRVDLGQVAARGRNKSAVKRAKAILYETNERAARDEADAAAADQARAIEATPSVREPDLDPDEALVSSPHGDPLATHVRPDQTSAAADADRRRLEEEEAARLARAQSEAAALAESTRRHVRLAALADEAVATAAEQDFPVARKRFGAIRREWRSLAADITVDADLAAKFAAFDGQMTVREQEANEADARVRREGLALVQQLLGRLEPLTVKPDLSLKVGDRALREVRTALSAMPHLPSKQDFDEVSRRLKTVQAALTPKVVELREADDWRRFANASVQEQLCARMEALGTAPDLEAAAREVRELQQQWRTSSDVPRAQADALWRRFKAAHDQVWARCEAHFAAEDAQRAANLAKKVTLCEQAESQAESTQWIQTAEEIKKLQADWKTIGPVSRGKEKAVWDRFRAACDRFFTRRHEDLAQRKTVWADNLAKKDALSAQAEALAASSDWDRAAAEIRRLQAEWKTIGPIKKSRSEATWQRFRGACDTFFARYAQRHDTARAERVAAREALCVEFEALSAGEQAPADLVTTIRTLQSRWQQEIAARGVEPDQARQFDQRFGAALTAVIARWPLAFAGTDLDIEANQKRMDTLVRRVEELAKSFTGPVPADDTLSPTVRMAVMLKEALAANTIGGKVDDASRLRAAAEEVRQAQAAWSRIGLVAEEVRRPLSDRFQRAVRSVNQRASTVGPAAFAPDGASARRPARPAAQVKPGR